MRPIRAFSSRLARTFANTPVRPGLPHFGAAPEPLLERVSNQLPGKGGEASPHQANGAQR